MGGKHLIVRFVELFQSLGTVEAYALIFLVLLFCGLGLPVPEDITLITAGVISASGNISLPGAMIVCFVGVLAGDAILFFLGRKFGPRVFTWPLFRRAFTPDRVAKAEVRIRKNARLICFVARFTPGLRAPVYLTAGTMGVTPLVFLVSDGGAALISVPVWIAIGHWFGTNLDFVVKIARQMNYIIVGALVAGILAYLIYRKFRKPKI